MLSNANAGFHAFTTHSRANCVNNESISWEWNVYRELGTVSHHLKGGQLIHVVNTGWQYTWRSAAVHWGESPMGGNWYVVGYHWQRQNGQEVMIDYTQTGDCSQYDGWWNT
jgi:hypothetical protein